MAIPRPDSRTLALIFVLFLPTSSAQGNVLWANSSTTKPSRPSSSSASTSLIISTDQQSSSPNAQTVSDNIGDYIAASLGLPYATNTPSTANPPIITHSDEVTLTSSTSTTPATTLQTISGNYPLTFTGNCWEQWSAYWSATLSASSAWTRVSVPTTSTYTFTEWSISGTTEHLYGTTTVTVKNGAFAQTTFTTVTETDIEYVPLESSPTNTIEKVLTWNNGYITSLFEGTIVQPTCVLPSLVPECQSSWEKWVSQKYESIPEAPNGCTSYEYKAVSLQPPSCRAPLSSHSLAESIAGENHYRSPPPCAQATVTGALCSTLVSDFLRTAKYYNQQTDGVVAGTMNYTIYTTTDASNSHVATITSNIYYWDPSSSFAPGCTLGCQDCQINGGTVQLIYWPPASNTWIDGKYSAISGPSNETFTIVTLGTTFTSPTVYVSFDSLYARDSCSAFGRTYSNQIVAITETANLSSLYGWVRYNGLGWTASFNFTDLYISPVPDNIYQSQPRCASSMAMFDPRKGPYALSSPANWSCPRTAPYEPILAIPVEVRQIDPDWIKCVGGINGVYDPPIALTPAGAILKPTFPEQVPDTISKAVPASTSKPTLATVTPTVKSKKAATPASTGKIQNSRPDSPHVDGSPTTPDANDEQADDDGQPPAIRPTASTRRSRSISPAADGLPTQVFEGVEIRPTENTVLDVVKSNINVPSDLPRFQETVATIKPQTDALSVLLEAQSSIDAATRQQDNAEQTHPPSLPATRIEPAKTFESSSDGIGTSTPAVQIVVAMADGDSVTIYEAGSSVFIEHDGSSITTAPGSEVLIDSHAFSAATSGGAIVIDHSVTHAVPSSNGQSPALATFVAGDDTVTTYNQGSIVVLVGSSQTLTAQLGGSENGIVVQQGTSKVTLAAGQETTFNGHTLSAAQSGSVLIVDGSVMTITPTGFPNASSSKKVEAASDSRSANAADAAGATDTVEVTTSRSSTSESSNIPVNAALRSMANTSLRLLFFCVMISLWAGSFAI